VACGPIDWRPHHAAGYQPSRFGRHVVWRAGTSGSRAQVAGWIDGNGGCSATCAFPLSGDGPGTRLRAAARGEGATASLPQPLRATEEVVSALVVGRSRRNTRRWRALAPVPPLTLSGRGGAGGEGRSAAIPPPSCASKKCGNNPWKGSGYRMQVSNGSPVSCTPYPVPSRSGKCGNNSGCAGRRRARPCYHGFRHGSPWPDLDPSVPLAPRKCENNPGDQRSAVSLGRLRPAPSAAGRRPSPRKVRKQRGSRQQNRRLDHLSRSLPPPASISTVCDGSRLSLLMKRVEPDCPNAWIPLTGPPAGAPPPAAPSGCGSLPAARGAGRPPGARHRGGHRRERPCRRE
jgi:hypothetical protein